MVSVVIWLLVAAAVFAWNQTHPGSDFLGIRFTERFFGFPVSGAWLALVVSGYCLVRFFVRRKTTPPQQ